MSGMEFAFVMCQFNILIGACFGGRFMSFLGWATATYLMYLRLYGG